MLRIFKFGGSLLKDIQGIQKAAAIIEDFSCEPLVVVVSALGKNTNKLEHLLKLSLQNDTQELQQAYFKVKQFHLQYALRLLPDSSEMLTKKLEEEFEKLWDALTTSYPDRYIAYDQIVSFGEVFASLMMQHYLDYKNLNSKLVDARCVIVTDSNYTNASINWKMTNKTMESQVTPALDSKRIVLTQGFIGSDEAGNTTTLGREGSDFSAAIFANILDAEELSIWKDVPGLMNCDPNRFPDAEKLAQISYREAVELAFYGASVIHPKTIQPLRQKNIPLKVRSFYHPQSEPSLVTTTMEHDNEIHKIIVKDNQVLLSIGSRKLSFIAEENLTEIFDAFSKHKIHLNLMQNSAVSFSVCFNQDKEKLNALIAELQQEYILKYNDNLELITIRHYDDKLISSFTQHKKIYLEQKSRSTVQLLVKGLPQ